MDALDLRILATMGYVPWGPTAGDVDRLRPTSLADQLEVTPETVRERLDAMETAGVVRSWEAYPNPTHFDHELGGWALCPSSRDLIDEVLDEILLLDGVIEVFTYRGPFAGLALAYEDETQRDRRLELLARRLQGATPVHVLDPPMPAVDRDLDGTDWRILAALQGQARRPLSDVAEEVSRSYRTVKRRFDRMRNEGSLFLAPRVDLSRVAGILPFTLVLTVAGPPAEVANRLSSTLGDRLLHRLIPPDPEARLLVVGAHADTVSEMESVREEVEHVEGIEQARAVLSAGRHATGWLEERIRSRLVRA